MSYWFPDTSRVFQPFAKVWTPRTPDSSYDSFGIYPPPPVRVMVPLISESVGSGVTYLANASSYYAHAVPIASAEQAGSSVSLVSATYTP